MDATDLAFAGAARQAALVADNEVSPRELVDAFLERIERLDPQLNAFRVVLAEQAREEAESAARRKADGRPLLGVPVAIKDDVDVAGEVTTYGSAAHGPPATEDAEVVRRLREAGAIVIGKTLVPELMIWPFTESMTFGVTRNPWDPQRTPGGSSGGTGAAIAAGLAGVGLGSDGAGSIRIPGAWCGLFGLKPQRDRVPMAPHDGAWQGLSVNGPLARTVADAALFMDAVADDPPADGGFSAAARTVPGTLRIAVSTKVPTGFIARVGAEQRRALDETAELLRSLGHTVVERDPDYPPTFAAHGLARYFRGIADDVASLPHQERLDRRTRSMARIGGLISDEVIASVRAGEAAVAGRLLALFDDHDVLMTPGTAQPPFRVGQLHGRGGLWTLNASAARVPHQLPFNVTGQPAASVPAGFDADGLPLAVQLVARPRDEATLLALAAQIEAERPWADRRPPLAA